MGNYNIDWYSDGNTMFGAATAGSGKVLYRLIVEKLPKDKGWDWSVWQAGSTGTAIGHGPALSSLTGFASAERAARAWHTMYSP
jgi:hypothetical protein